MGVPAADGLHQRPGARRVRGVGRDPFGMGQQRDGEGGVGVDVVDIDGVGGGVEPEQQRVQHLPAGRRGHQPHAVAVVVEAQPASVEIELRTLHRPVQRDAVAGQIRQAHDPSRGHNHPQCADRHGVPAVLADRLTVSPAGGLTGRAAAHRLPPSDPAPSP